MTPHERVQIAAAVGCDPRTVLKWSRDPDSVRGITATALSAAAKKLGIALPENPQEPTGADNVVQGG
jgi:hypothetical protein